MASLKAFGCDLKRVLYELKLEEEIDHRATTQGGSFLIVLSFTSLKDRAVSSTVVDILDVQVLDIQ